jgi:hypothetical protein
MTMAMQPFVDPAHPILAGDPTLDQDTRASLWDIFHGSKDSNDLAQKLQALAVPDDTKQRLFDAKKQATLPVEPVDQTIAAMEKLKQIDPAVLELAETHPNALKALTGAAQAGAKAAAEPAGAGKPAGKGKAATAGAKLPPLAQPPRVDGLEHFPVIPEGHRRVMASDGGIHDIPEENLDKAREIDPRLHVLNP